MKVQPPPEWAAIAFIVEFLIITHQDFVKNILPYSGEKEKQNRIKIF